MRMDLTYRSHAIEEQEFPAPREPDWAPHVDRWNQLDEAAFALIQAYWKWNSKEDVALVNPALIVLASPGASNATDWAFAHTGAVSPARFAHTLPNTRGTALLQAMGWTGPLLCVQNGSRTLASGLAEGAYALSAGGRTAVWVLGVAQGQDAEPRARTFGFFLRASQSGAPGLEIIKEKSAAKATGLPSDAELLKWLEDGTSSEAALELGDGLRIERRSAT